MATHNEVRIVGYLKKDPMIMNPGVEGEEKILCTVRVANRELDGYNDPPFQNILLYYDGTEMMDQIKKLKAYDLIDVKGVVNVLNMYKRSVCPSCGKENKKGGTFFGVYPIHISKLNGLQTVYEHDSELPDEVLIKHYREVSNHALVIGHVNTIPEMPETDKGICCRYRLFVERKYCIKTQDDIKADYPFIYSYGRQALDDIQYLKPGSLVLADGFIRMRSVKNKTTCGHCGCDYQFPDVACELIPYNVEYFRGYYTQEEVDQRRLEQAKEAEKAVLGAAAL